jgi:hypothetical protein
MLTTTGLPAARASSTASRICSEAVSEPPGEETRNTIALTASSSIASRNARVTSSERTVLPPPRGLGAPPPDPVMMSPSSEITATVGPEPSSLFVVS